MFRLMERSILYVWARYWKIFLGFVGQTWGNPSVDVVASDLVEVIEGML